MKKFTLLFLFILVVLAIIFAIAPNFVLAQEESVKLINPLGFHGFEINSPGELVAIVFKGFAGLIGAIAIAFTVYSGFKLVIASNEESIKTAKDSITWSVGGFVVSLLAFSIISGASRLLGFDPSLINFNEDKIDTVLSGPQDPRTFVGVMNYLMVNFLGLVGFATTFMIIYYGYRYLTSAGNEEQVEQAKSGLRWSLVGLVVVLLAFGVITITRQLLLVGPGN